MPSFFPPPLLCLYFLSFVRTLICLSPRLHSILASASYNPFLAARFYSPEHAPTPSHEPPPTHSTAGWTLNLFGGGSGRRSHPSEEERAKAVRRELERWEGEWEKRRAKRGEGVAEAV